LIFICISINSQITCAEVSLTDPFVETLYLFFYSYFSYLAIIALNLIYYSSSTS